MTTLLYDGTFEGLMTAIFEVYEYRFEPAKIIATENYQSESIFTDHHEVITNHEKADRVLKMVENNLGRRVLHNCFEFISLKMKMRND